MIDCKDLDYVALVEFHDKKTGLNTITAPAEVVINQAQIEILDWMLNQTMTGMTLPMIRAVIRDKRAEISGE